MRQKETNVLLDHHACIVANPLVVNNKTSIDTFYAPIRRTDVRWRGDEEFLTSIAGLLVRSWNLLPFRLEFMDNLMPQLHNLLTQGRHDDYYE